MEDHAHHAETQHTAETDDPLNIQEQSAVIPEPHIKQPDPRVTDDVFHHTGDQRTEKKQQDRMTLQRFQRVDTQSADAVDRQPGSEEDPAVSQHSLGEPVKDLFVKISQQTSGQKDQKQIAYTVNAASFISRYSKTRHFFLLFPSFRHSVLLLYKIMRIADRMFFQQFVSVL